MLLNQTRMDSLIRTARAKAESFHALDMPNEGKGPLEGYCILFAGMMAETLREEGIRNAGIFAGTAYWRRCKPEEDTGPPFTPDFGYQFDWGPAAMTSVFGGSLPEMHVWCCITDLDYGKVELIDLTTRCLPSRAASFGYAWTAQAPPDCLWCLPGQMPDGFTYGADHIACQIARHFWACMRHGYQGPMVLRTGKAGRIISVNSWNRG